MPASPKSNTSYRYNPYKHQNESTNKSSENESFTINMSVSLQELEDFLNTYSTHENISDENIVLYNAHQNVSKNNDTQLSQNTQHTQENTELQHSQRFQSAQIEHSSSFLNTENDMCVLSSASTMNNNDNIASHTLTLDEHNAVHQQSNTTVDRSESLSVNDIHFDDSFMSMLNDAHTLPVASVAPNICTNALPARGNTVSETITHESECFSEYTTQARKIRLQRSHTQSHDYPDQHFCDAHTQSHFLHEYIQPRLLSQTHTQITESPNHSIYTPRVSLNEQPISDSLCQPLRASLYTIPLSTKQDILTCCKLAQGKALRRETDVTAIYKDNICISIFRHFSRYFPQEHKIVCNHYSMDKCVICDIASELDTQTPGDMIIRQALGQNVRISQMCNAIAACVLMLRDYSPVRYTLAHDKYIHNIKTYILSEEYETVLMMALYNDMPIYVCDNNNVLSYTQNIHVTNAEFIRQHHKELKQLFLHKFVTYIKDTYMKLCDVDSTFTTDDSSSTKKTKKAKQQDEAIDVPGRKRKLRNNLQLLFEQQIDDYYIVASDIENMRRDMNEYADRMQHIKQSLLSDEQRVYAAVSTQPFMPYVFLLLDASDILGVLLKHEHTIPSGTREFVHIVRRPNIVAEDALKMQVSLVEHYDIAFRHSIMFSLDTSRLAIEELDSRQEQVDDNYLTYERRKYLQQLRDICVQKEANACIQLIDSCMNAIDQYFAADNDHHICEIAPSLSKYKLKQEISNIYAHLCSALELAGFQVSKVLYHRYKSYKAVTYGKFNLQDTVEQVVVLDAIDVSLCHTFYIFQDAFNNTRNIMLNILLNIWFYGGGTKGEALNAVMSQYDDIFMKCMSELLSTIQTHKVNNLHTLLPYELTYLHATQQSCILCNIIHAGHYSDIIDRDICVSLLCVQKALQNLMSLLPSAACNVSLSEVLTHRQIDADYIVRDITNRLVDGGIRIKIPKLPAPFLLNERFCKIFTLPFHKFQASHLNML